ncbi:MAG: DNA double-strand break repair nuclease NurA [Thermoplasmata archaeon]|nr:DNA double-strand break repair nuclease NurA [Thermoplasmata archaeon]
MGKLKPEELRDLVKRIHRYSVSAPDVEVDVKEFGEVEGPKQMIAVDGSYTFLFCISNAWLGIVRACALHYENSDSEYKLVKARLKEEPVLISRNEELLKENDALHRIFLGMNANTEDFERKMINGYRAHLEELLAYEIAKEEKGCMIAMDGALYERGPGRLKELAELCTQRSNILLGISKDSAMHMFGSLKTDEELLKDIDVGKAFVKPKRPFGVVGDTYFAKLHPDSKKWFRVELGTGEGPEDIFPAISSYSKSQLCLGYPYPLLEAHRFVVVVRRFQDVYENEVLSAAMELGMPVDSALENMTRWEGERKGAFHEYIDSVTRSMK